MAEFSAIPQLPAFSSDADPTSAAQCWKLKNLLIALNITNNDCIRFAGEAIYEIHDGLVVADVAEEANLAVDNIYINAKKALNESRPKVKRFTRSNKTRTRQQMPTTHGSAVSPGTVTSQIVILKSNCTSSRFRNRAVSKPGLMLKQLLDIIRSMEAAERQVTCI